MNLKVVKNLSFALFFLYFFLVSIKLLEKGIKTLGAEYTDQLFESVSNPFAGLLVGILCTVLVQSSSVTTSTIVGLTKMAENGTEFIIASGFTATKPNSPIKAAIKWGSNNILDGLTSIPFIGNLSENSYRVYAVLLIVIAIGLIFLCLKNVVSNMKSLMMNQIEMGLDRALARGGGLFAILIGILITFSVQSSSITTSILVPIVGSGILSIQNAFPITLGANIGTTITAVLASFVVDNTAGLTIALHHVFFNTIGVMIVYPVKFIRNLPVNLAVTFSNVVAKRRYIAILYVLVTFLLLPLLGVVISN